MSRSLHWSMAVVILVQVAGGFALEALPRGTALRGFAFDAHESLGVFLLALLAVRAYDEGSAWRRHWAGLTVIFLLLAYDEASSLHERLVPIIRQAAHTEGLLYYGWIIPGAVFALVVGLVYLRFVLALPRAVAVSTIVGGALYITGTLGVEAISGAYVSTHHDMTGYLLITTIEESLDMLGLIVFGYGLMSLLAEPDGRVLWPGGRQGI